MADRISKEHRSWNMSRIRGKDTKPEKDMRSALHRLGFRFRKNVKNLPGNPDIVLPKYRTVVFVHGCFWHCHKGCPYAYQPKTNSGFWSEKLQGNVQRDARNIEKLIALGWQVITVWECQVNDASMVKRVADEIRRSA
jgi:DNA mismatch endonuclease (patch repair protein)